MQTGRTGLSRDRYAARYGRYTPDHRSNSAGNGVIVVTTPQLVALADAKKGITMFGQAQLKVPVIGLVENMSYFTPAELPDNKYYIFRKDGGKIWPMNSTYPCLARYQLYRASAKAATWHTGDGQR